MIDWIISIGIGGAAAAIIWKKIKNGISGKGGCSGCGGRCGGCGGCKKAL